MYKERSILAVIPARGGSKRLPGKNIKDLAGKPLIAWTIEAAKESEVFDKIMVSTDDSQIAKISNEYSAEVPFLRKESLASDTATSIDVVLDVFEFYKSRGEFYDIIVLLQPTSPLRDATNIREAVDQFLIKSASSIISVCEVDHPVQWSNELSNDLSMDNFIRDEYKNKRSQDFPKSYRINGAIYIWDSNKLLEKKTGIIENSYAYIMDRQKSIDIDEEIDFIFSSILKTKSILK